MRRMIFIFSGPSGAGKTTLIKHVLQTFDREVGVSISCTTRPPRGHELDGVDYHFIPPAQFATLVQNGAFLEHTECYGNRYGTLKSSVDDLLQIKLACIMDVEYQGASEILSDRCVSWATKIGILVLPPSIATLKRRLMNRKSETEESLNRRITGSFDVGKVAAYDYILVNNEIDRSRSQICQIVEKHLSS
ncbi:MAG: guanylate kinase [Holosporales bacterium]|jgi:guanylate kinase|nr:guanylate kinase [Holosporales bacterium]